MVHDFKLVLDPAPNGVYTYEDTVSGRVIFESSHEEHILGIYVFFIGWVHAELITTTSGNGPHSRWIPKNNDKEVLFQGQQKVYEGAVKLNKKLQYSWPFKFSFQGESAFAKGFPTSGKYSFRGSNQSWSSVEYKVIAVKHELGQKDDQIRWMLNPESYMISSSISTSGILNKFRETKGVFSDQQIKFVQIRSDEAIDQSMDYPTSWDLNIDERHLPQLARPTEYDGRKHRGGEIQCSIDLCVPSDIIIGVPFSLLLSVSSKNVAWQLNPPPVTLKTFQIKSFAVDGVIINQGGDYAPRIGQELRVYTLFEGGRINIPLTTVPVDIGKTFLFQLTGDGIVPSFQTPAGLLTRNYSFPVELTVDIAGHSHKALYALNHAINVLSPSVAKGSQPNNLEKWSLQSSHIGRLVQDGNGPYQPDSVMEAAIALSQTLNKMGIRHCFPGGSLIELLPDADRKPDPKTTQDAQSIYKLLFSFFSLYGGKFQFPAKSSGKEFVPQLHLKFYDNKHNTDVTVAFPDLLSRSNDPKKIVDSIQLTALSLFNYRIRVLATNDAAGGDDVKDTQYLFETFKHELRMKRSEIHFGYAKIAAKRYPDIWNIMVKAGVDLSAEAPPEPQGIETEGYRPYGEGPSRGYEEELTQGLQRKVYLDDEETLPRYEP